MTIQTITEISTKDLVVELEMALENQIKTISNEHLFKMYKHKYFEIKQELIKRGLTY